MAELGLKEMAGARTPKFGHFVVEFATPGIGHILKSAGCDFALLDLEHSGFGFETVKSALRYFEAADLPTIVRVPSREYHHIARAMDMGAEGLMLPMVGNVDEVRHIVLVCVVAQEPDGIRRHGGDEFGGRVHAHLLKSCRVGAAPEPRLVQRGGRLGQADGHPQPRPHRPRARQWDP